MASFRSKSSHKIRCAPQIATLKQESSARGDKSGYETWMCAFAPDESYFGWSCGNRMVVLVPWNAHKSCPLAKNHKDATGNGIYIPEITINCGHLVWSLAFSYSGSIQNSTNYHSTWTHFHSEGNLILATGLSSSRIRIWDVPTGKLLMELMDHKDIIRDLAFAPDGSLRLVSASKDATLKVWDLCDSGNMFKTLVGHRKWIFACKWSPNSRILASVGSGKMVMVWNMDTYKLHKKLEGHVHDVVACDFSIDGAVLATASWDTRVLLWDPDTGEILKSLGHLHPPPRPIFACGANGSWVRGVCFSSDGCHLASVADDGYVRFWNLYNDEDPVEVATVENTLCCTFSPSGRALAVGTQNGCVSFFPTPVSILSLQQICRLSVRKLAGSSFEELELPWTVERFLKYKDWDR